MMAFYQCHRLGTKQLLAAFVRIPNVTCSAPYASTVGAPKLNFKPYESPKQENYLDRNERLQRPLSPHLTIYARQLTSGLSITHRFAGIIATGYFSGLAFAALVFPNDVSHYVTMIEGLNLSAATIFIAKFLLAAPFSFHFANGIRHLYWDTGKGLTLKQVYQTGYTVLALTVVTSLILAAL